ncbi:transporter substrate-binding domain-containing protein [Phaeobacter sp. J2-8]|uniref:transporter substrate-binding domain-containing protein n=1 Tax=Phaeobacter sp. J2-8 TaxID=2931394 RepID=UPI001FD07D38|nr:transporter substrate-binding domain-containing protein [Phaeobacter sp. J2-8]MCJ7873350.1 transporter substrate-binding domain-containing protein [Phaeobacter sp. J2-8]
MKHLLLTAAATLMLNPVSAVAEDLLSRITADGVLTVGTEARFPPFEFVENGEIVGYSGDIMEILMDSALPEVELKRLDLPWQGILPGLAAERFDYVVTSVTVTPARRDAYYLSVPIADATMAVLKRAGDDSIGAPADMAGKPVGSQAGSAQLAALEGYADTLDDTPKISTYTDFSEAYADLAAGRIDAVVNSLPNLLEAARQRPDIFEVVAPTFGEPTYFSWAGRTDEDSASLNALFDAELKRLIEDGTLAQLQEKWFGGAMNLPSALPAQ